MKRGESGNISVRSLDIMVSDETELSSRVAECLGDDWLRKLDQQVTYQLPEHCTRFDSETVYWWSDSVVKEQPAK